MPRLFTGISLPEAIREQLSDLECPLPGTRWANIDDMHLTLRFAGDIDNGLAREFSDMLAGISVDAFLLRLSGLGTFGGKIPHLLYAGVEECPMLETLARANERAAVSAGLPAAARAFKPHVTVARLHRPNVDRLATFLGRNASFRSSAFHVTQFDLFSAKPHTGGGPYVSEETFYLRGGDFSDLQEFDAR